MPAHGVLMVAVELWANTEAMKENKKTGIKRVFIVGQTWSITTTSGGKKNKGGLLEGF